MKSFIEPLESRIAPATLAISPVTVSQNEGDADNTISFHVHLDTEGATLSGDTTFHLAAVNGTAVADTDFAALSNDFTFHQGETDLDVSVTIKGDTVVKADRTFTVQLSNPNNGVTLKPNESTATVNIIEDDGEVTLTAANTQVQEGNVGATNTADFTVALTGGTPLSHDVIVNLTYIDGTAKSVGQGKDYDASAVTQVTIPAGQTSVVFHVPVIGDLNLGGDENFTVAIGNATGAKVGAASSSQITILNDDDTVATPKLSFSGPTASINEGQSADFTFTLDQASESDIVVHYTTGAAGDTATAGSDYTAPSGTFTIASGKLSDTLHIATVQDSIAEHNAESFTVKIDSAVPGNNNLAIEITNDTAVATIAADPTPKISIGDLTFAEGNSGTKVATFDVHLSSAADRDITVAYTTAAHSGAGFSATDGVDYVGTSGTLTFLAGQTTATAHLDVTINGDTTPEADEKFDVVLSNPVNAALDPAHTVGVATLQNDDTFYSIVNTTDGGSSVSVDESAGTVSFKVTRNDGTVPGSVHVTAKTGVAGDGVRGSVSGADFAAYDQNVDFAIGETEKTVTIQLTDDDIYEGAERFTVELSAPVNGLLDATHTVGTVLLADNDAAPVITIAPTASATEGGPVHFTVNLSRASELPIQVSYYTTDGVTSGSVFGASANDYTGVPQATPGTLTIPANTTTATLDIATTQDLAVEHDEVFTVTLAGTDVGAAKTATGTIVNDDTGVVHVTKISSVSILEGSDPDPNAPKMLDFTIELDRPIDASFPLTFSTVNGTGANAAIAGDDFVAQTNVAVTIPANHLTPVGGKYLVHAFVPLVGDSLPENDETFSIKLSTTNSAAVSLDQSTATGTILNDDLGLHVTDVQVQEGDSGTTTAVFTISLDRALTAGQSVTLDYKTADGTATSTGTVLGTGAKDYEALTAANQTLTFDSTHSFRTVSVTVYGDKVSEGLDLQHAYETFKLQLSNAKLNDGTVLTLSDAEAVAQILDNDPHTSVVSVAPVSPTQAEGNTGTETAAFKVNLSTALQHDVVVKYKVTGVANPNPNAISVTIPAGQTSADISVAYAGNETVNGDSTITVAIDSIDPLPAGEITTVSKSASASTAKVILLDDDAVVKLTAPVDANEGAAGASHVVNYTFSLVDAHGDALTTPLDHDVVISYSTADGTAKAGSDYQAAASGAKATILKGTTSVTVPVTVLGDNLAGDDETFTFSANSVTGAHLLTTPTTVTTKILNDDGALPKVVVQSASGDEGSNIIFTVKLVDANGNNVAADSDVVVNFHTTDGTATATTGPATAGTDYTAITSGGTVTIAAGNTGAQFAVKAYTEVGRVGSNGLPVLDSNGQQIMDPVVDSANEGAETFNVVVDSAKFASSSANVDPTNVTGGVGTINPSDLPTITIDTSTLRLTEGNNGPANQFITVKLSAQATNAVNFTLSTSGGTATAGTDYTTLTDAPFSIPAGASSVQVPISLLGDTVLEHDETFNLTLKLAPNSPALLPQNAPITATAVIADDEVTYSIHKDGDAAAAVVEVSETDGFAIFKVTRTDTSVASTIHYSTVEGTAKSSGDNLDFRAVSGDLTFAAGTADATIRIPIVDDHRFEGTEQFTVVLSNPTNGIVSTQGVGTVKINDNEAPPVVTVTGAKDVLEGNTGTRTMTFTVKLSQQNDAQDVVLHYSTSDVSTTTGVFSATAGEDYTAKTDATVTIPKGQLSATFTVEVLSDNRFDSGLREQLQVNLSFATPATAGATFLGGATQISARGAIVDDDPLPVITVSAASATEGSNLGFTVSLDRPSDLPIHLLYYTTDGTATAGADFTGFTKLGQQPLDFAKGETSKQIVIATANDDIAEGDETFQLHVAKAPGAFFAKLNPKTTNLTGTILDDDHAFVTVNDVQVQEGDSGTTNAVFHVNLSSVTSKDVLVRYSTVDGTAAAGSDFTARTGTLVIHAGSTSGDIIIPVRGDLAQETYIETTSTGTVSHGPETFQVKLTSATNADLARDTGTGTIIDSEDTGATLNLANVQVVEGTSSGAVGDTTSTITFVPTLTKVISDHDVTFTISTAPAQTLIGAAQAGSDYVSATKTMTIKAGHLTPDDSFSVTVNKDAVFEATESFSVKLSNIVGAIAGDTTATGTIFNDDLSVSAKTVKWVDADGELVTLTTSKGNLTHAGFSFDTTTASVTQYGGRTLSQLNLSAQEFLRANISITAKPQPGFPTNIGVTQDNLVNVGTIRSNNLTSTDDLLELQGVDLGNVTVQGDLGSIIVGDIYNDSSLQRLSVKSFGVVTPGQTSLAIGNIESLNVAGDFMGNLQVKGNKDGSINHIRIGGLIDGTGVNPDDATALVGAITVKGAIRDAIVGGLKGGSLAGSGSIVASSAFGKIVGLTVKGDVTGGAGVGSGEIFSTNNIDALVINGSVIGGAGNDSGFIFAGTKLGALRIDGNLANTATSPANPTITGLQPGSASALAGSVETGSVIAGSMGSVKIGGSIVGGRIVSTGAISALTVDGDVKAIGTNDAYVIAGGLNAEVALPSILVKGQATNAHFLAGYFRDIESQTDNTVPTQPVTTTRTFYTPANADAQIGSVEFDGAVQNIDIVAGAMPGSFSHTDGASKVAARSYGDKLFGTADDVIIADVSTGIGVIDQAGVSSRIAQIVFKGGILTNNVEHGIVAQQIGSVIIDGDLQQIVGSNAPVEVQTGSKFYYHKVL